MTAPKSLPTPAKQALAPAAPPAGLIGSWVNFWFAAIDPVGLHMLRVLAGLLFLFWLLPFAWDHQALFSLGGWFDATAYRDASRLSDLPSHLFGWSVVYWCGTNAIALSAVYWLSITAIALFTLGLGTRVTGVLTWVAVVSYTASPPLSYEADSFLVLLAFYLMVGYLLLGQANSGQSLLARLLGSKPAWWRTRSASPGAVSRSESATESVAANLALRLFQVHFAIALVAGGLHKLQVGEWWSGLALWYYVNPPFQTSKDDVQSLAPSAGTMLTLFTLASYLVLAWQLAFPAFAWRRSLRPVLLGGAVVAWLACAFLMPLPLFGPLMVVACLAYLTPAEWRRLQALAARLPVVGQLTARLPAPQLGLSGPKNAVLVKASAASLGQR